MRRRSLDDEGIGRQVRRSFLDSDRACGARRVWRDVLEAGFRCGLPRIERLMQAQALRARPRRRGLPLDRGDRPSGAGPEPAGPVVFEAKAPDRKWVADFTCLCATEGCLDRALALDLYSRCVVGWWMQSQMTA